MINSLHVADPEPTVEWCIKQGYTAGTDYDYWWLGEDNRDRGYLFIFHRTDDMVACKIAVPCEPPVVWG